MIKSLLLVIFVGIAGVIYTSFSHGVTSPFMSFAFMWLLLGFILKYILKRFIRRKPRRWVTSIHNGLWLSYMLNATLGSIIIGIINIAGSYTDLLYGQLFVGLLSLALYLLLSIVLLWTSH
ncbi:MAG: hypothetical protein KGZ51_08250 [Erysipelothrix sp.]|jgi:drug/metabolite transporter (DMT)-like permease|nr:hypothetical protein [Erysipelothrix sp.]